MNVSQAGNFAPANVPDSRTTTPQSAKPGSHDFSSDSSKQADVAQARVSREEAAKAAEEMNKHLTETGTKVVLDPDATLNHMWLNVVDSQTGQVIEKLPPEGIRKFFESQQATGLTIDTKG